MLLLLDEIVSSDEVRAWGIRAIPIRSLEQDVRKTRPAAPYARREMDNPFCVGAIAGVSFNLRG